MEQSVELVSDAQLEEGLDAVGLDEAAQQEVVDLYATRRTQAFQAGVFFLVFTALLGLILTTGLADRRLVESK